MLVNIFIIIAAVLGMMFPYYLITAIRSSDTDKYETAAIKCCLIFGALVLVSLMVLRS